MPPEIDIGEEQEFEAYEAIVLKRAMTNSRIDLKESTADIVRQNSKLTAIRHEQEQETIIEQISIDHVLELVEKDQKKVDFLLTDLNLQKTSLEKTILVNQEISRNTERGAVDDDVETVNRLRERWSEVVDLIDSKTPMLINAIKARDKESEEFRSNMLRKFESSAVYAIELDSQIRSCFSELPVEEIFQSICSKNTISDELWLSYQTWIDSLTTIFDSQTRSLLLEHFVERGRRISSRSYL